MISLCPWIHTDKNADVQTVVDAAARKLNFDAKGWGALGADKMERSLP